MLQIAFGGNWIIGRGLFPFDFITVMKFILGKFKNLSYIPYLLLPNDILLILKIYTYKPFCK